MSWTIKENVTLETITCTQCGVVFAMPKYLKDRRYEDARNFYCPNGHSLSWTKSEADRLREQLAIAQRNLTQARCETVNERTAREAAEKKLKRVHAGVCPCCKRTFQNLQRHIATNHPELPGAQLSTRFRRANRERG